METNSGGTLLLFDFHFPNRSSDTRRVSSRDQCGGGAEGVTTLPVNSCPTDSAGEKSDQDGALGLLLYFFHHAQHVTAENLVDVRFGVAAPQQLASQVR